MNAFFVREDLVDEQFAEPFTAENHYETPRYYLRMPNGHHPGFGPTVSPSTLAPVLGGAPIDDAAGSII